MTDMTAPNGSKTNPSCTEVAPNANQRKLFVARAESACSVAKNATQASTNEKPMAPMANPALNRRCRLGSKAAIPAASSGAVGMSQRYLTMDSILTLLANQTGPPAACDDGDKWQ